MKSGQQKILCRDNDYVKNKATAENETKKCFDRTKIHGPNQYAMSNRSYKPNNQDTRNNINIVHFTPQQQQHKSPDQLFLHLGDFMKGEIDTMTKTADKKCKQKNIKLLNSANEAAACLVALTSKDHHKKIPSLEEMQAYMREQLTKEKKDLPMKVVKTTMMMMNRCQKQLDFKLNIYSVCTFYYTNRLY